MVMSAMGLETKNQCAGEGQQKLFSSQSVIKGVVLYFDITINIIQRSELKLQINE
jgi:hypothetical protein